jgi:hypothetical protein
VIIDSTVDPLPDNVKNFLRAINAELQPEIERFDSIAERMPGGDD